MIASRVKAIKQKPKMVSCKREVIAGPITAAQLGVPIGTIVDTTETRFYRNPLKQLWWRFKHPGTGRIQMGGVS